MGENAAPIRVVSENRRAFHDYHVLEKLEAGLALTGTEIKSARQGKLPLAVGRGKKLHDKRQAEQAREKEMEARKAMSLRNTRRIRD